MAHPAPPIVAAGRLADFVILGAAKAGTTTLYEMLSRDPRLFLSTPKEPNYFTTEYHRGPGWYAQLFAPARSDQLCGEATTAYTWWSDTPASAARMRRTIPQARLIYLMRHPVDRAYSHYREQIKGHQLSGKIRGYRYTFEQYVQMHDFVLAASDYPRKIEPYLEQFGDEAVRLMLLEDLSSRPQQALAEVSAHLGLPGQPAAAAESVTANVHDDFVKWYARHQLLDPLRRLPVLGRVGRRLPQPVKDTVYRLVSRSSIGRRHRAAMVPPPMQPRTRQRLLEQFEPVVAWAEARLGRDLSDWRR